MTIGIDITLSRQDFTIKTNPARHFYGLVVDRLLEYAQAHRAFLQATFVIGLKYGQINTHGCS